jgi:adenosine kinase
MFDGNDLKTFIDQASYVTVNDYESQMMQERTSLSEGEIADRVQALIVTRGAEGSTVYSGGKKISIPVVAVDDLKDPTGCGDAYRAGLIYGIMNDMDWETTCRIASLLGAIKIQHHGTQNHTFSLAEFKDDFKKEFNREY